MKFKAVVGNPPYQVMMEVEAKALVRLQYIIHLYQLQHKLNRNLYL